MIQIMQRRSACAAKGWNRQGPMDKQWAAPEPQVLHDPPCLVGRGPNAYTSKGCSLWAGVTARSSGRAAAKRPAAARSPFHGDDTACFNRRAVAAKKKGPGRSGAFDVVEAGSVTGRACTGQQDLVDHVDHTIVGLDVRNHHIGAGSGAVSDGHTRGIPCDAQAL